MATNYLEKRPEASLDIECYRNYFLVKFRNKQTGKTLETMMFNGERELDRKMISNVIRNYRIITFNGNGYDMLLLAYAMAGATESELKAASDRIIIGKMKPWQFRDMYGVGMPAYLDHIDLMNVAPGQMGLKMYGGRVHSALLQDLPIHHAETIKVDQLPILSKYCGNDHLLTADVRDALKVEIEMREFMSNQFGLDLRSLSDAQIAEAVIKKQAEERLKRKVYKPEIDPGWTFSYVPPKYLEFKSEIMKKQFEAIKRSTFAIGYDGKVITPEALARKIPIGDGIYRMGIGGLHSSEKRISRYSGDGYWLIDVDATSYYPWLMINSGFSPSNMGNVFIPILKDHVLQRMKAKAAGLKKEAHSRKIIVNAVFGKLGSPTSIFYAPDMMIAVTVTGQLALLMMIEQLEMSGIQVVSANTDGVTSRVHESQMERFNEIVWDWEWATGFTTEENRYVSQHSRDVNNYFAIEAEYDKSRKLWLPNPKGIKAKGYYADEGLQKNPTNEICLIAIKKYLTEGADIRNTIKSCTDIRKFTTLRKVNQGGAHKDGEELGTTIRWYYSKSSPGPILKVSDDSTVPRSTGGKPLLDLPDEFPTDINYDWYIRETYWQLSRIGVDAGTPVLDGVEYGHGFLRVKSPKHKTIHWLDRSDRTTLCGFVMKDIHDEWLEHTKMPEGYKLCPKCKKIWLEDL